MGKVVVVLLCTLFCVGVVYNFLPGTAAPIAAWSHGVSWLLLIGGVAFIGSWRLVTK